MKTQTILAIFIVAVACGKTGGLKFDDGKSTSNLEAFKYNLCGAIQTNPKTGPQIAGQGQAKITTSEVIQLFGSDAATIKQLSELSGAINGCVYGHEPVLNTVEGKVFSVVQIKLD